MLRKRKNNIKKNTFIEYFMILPEASVQDESEYIHYL